jgi:hypothetical protein
MPDKHEIRVKPCGDGWTVECDEVGQPILFITGGRAEHHARAMAAAMAKAGCDVRLLICLMGSGFQSPSADGRAPAAAGSAG